MKTVSLSGSLRGNVGKKDAKKSRAEGLIPCVLYGGKEQIHFLVNDQAFSKLIFTPETYIIKLQMDGKEVQAILQDVQYHPVTDRVLHADFLEVIPDKPIKVALPVKIRGNSIGVMRGGRLIQNLRKLRIRGLMEDLPEFVEIDISNLDIGDTIKVEQLSFDKIDFMDVASQVIIAVKTTRTADATDEEADEDEEGETTTPEGSDEKAAEGSKE